MEAQEDNVQGRYKVYSAEFKVSKIEEFLKSGKSESAFCREAGICLSTFRSWRSKSGLGKAANPKKGNEGLTFIDVTDRIQSAMGIVTVPDREISFSVNGFLVKVSQKDLKAFIRGMREND